MGTCEKRLAAQLRAAQERINRLENDRRELKTIRDALMAKLRQVMEQRDGWEQAAGNRAS